MLGGSRIVEGNTWITINDVLVWLVFLIIMLLWVHQKNASTHTHTYTHTHTHTHTYAHTHTIYKYMPHAYTHPHNIHTLARLHERTREGVVWEKNKNVF